MNILLWILQVFLALFFFSGGAYKISRFDQIAEQMSPLSSGLASAIGFFEILGGIVLILPVLVKRMRRLVSAAAAALSLEALALSVLYASHSLDLTATNPLVWSLSMALLSAFVAYGRRHRAR